MANFNKGTDTPSLSPNDIPQVASVQRGGKAADISNLLNAIDTTTEKKVTTQSTTKPKPITSLKEFSKQQKEHQNDLKMLDSDLKLLSALLGRPITIAEIPSLVGQIGRGTAPTTVSPPPKRSSGTRSSTKSRVTSTTEISTSSESTEKSTSSTAFDESTSFQSVSESTTKISPDFYGKTNEAKIAAILRQQGIGPANNNIPVEVSFFLKFS